MRHFVMLCALAALAAAQPQRREIVNPSPNPADDARPNNPQVPDVYTVSGQFERVVILRLKYDADLLAGIESMVREQKIRNAVILSAVGSVRGYHIHQVS